MPEDILKIGEILPDEVIRQIELTANPIVEIRGKSGKTLRFVRASGAASIASKSVETNRYGWPVRRWRGQAV